MSKNVKIFLPILCTLALLLSVVGVVAVSGGSEQPKKGATTGVDAILERDGYLEGIWYPWLTHQNLGHGLASNELMTKYVGNTWSTVGIEQYGATSIYREIYNLRALGFNILGYEGSIYGEGVLYDDYGNVLGIKEEYLENVRLLLDICRAAKMPVLWTVCCHSTTLNDYYQDGKYAWDVISQAYANPKVADQYAANFVAPLCDVLAEYPDVVVMVAATSEAENEINDSSIGNHFEGGRLLYGVDQDAMLYFIKRINDTVAEKLPGVERTICANADDMTIYRDIEFTYLGRQIYNYAGNSKDIGDMKADRQMIVSEFGLGDNTVVSDEAFTILQMTFRDNFRADGYKGWMYWCWSSTGFGGVYDLLDKDGKSLTDFRAFAYALHYYIEEYRNEHRGVETVLDAPVLFCNTGSGLVEWISSRQATALDLMRSTDGGATWVTLLDGVSPYDYENNFKGSYEDTVIAQKTDGGKVMYKMVAYDDDGNRVESEISNEADILGPSEDLMVNGSFEDGLNGWSEWGINGDQFYGAALKTDLATDGDYVLDLRYTTGQWYGLCNGGIEVKPNTNYKITYDYYLCDDATSKSGYCFIRGLGADGSGNGQGDINDAVLASKFLNKATTSNTQGTWVTEEIIFRTNEGTKLGVDFRVIDGLHFYIDNVTLVEIR